MSEDVSEPAAEDVAFIGRHLQRFLDGVGEAVACEAEVLEHGGLLRIRLVLINVVRIGISLCENEVFEFHQRASEALIDESTEHTTAELIAHTRQQPPMLQGTHTRNKKLLC